MRPPPVCNKAHSSKSEHELPCLDRVLGHGEDLVDVSRVHVEVEVEKVRRRRAEVAFGSFCLPCLTAAFRESPQSL
jgi:hypothetical protein